MFLISMVFSLILTRHEVRCAPAGGGVAILISIFHNETSSSVGPFADFIVFNLAVSDLEYRIYPRIPAVDIDVKDDDGDLIELTEVGRREIHREGTRALSLGTNIPVEILGFAHFKYDLSQDFVMPDKPCHIISKITLYTNHGGLWRKQVVSLPSLDINRGMLKRENK